MQYTLRGVPKALDEALRERSRAQGKSLNEIAIEALRDGLGIGADLPVRDLSDVVGTWKKDSAAEAAFVAQDQVDKALWE